MQRYHANLQKEVFFLVWVFLQQVPLLNREIDLHVKWLLDASLSPGEHVCGDVPDLVSIKHKISSEFSKNLTFNSIYCLIGSKNHLEADNEASPMSLGELLCGDRL